MRVTTCHVKVDLTYYKKDDAVIAKNSTTTAST
jgi:hypothetical protein